MKHKVIFNLVFFLSLITATIHAQGKFAVRGKIIDASSGEPLIGVNVIEVDESERFLNGTISDFNGDFVLEVSSGSSKIQLKYIGYKDYMLDIKNKSYFTIKLESDIKTLNETVVTAQRSVDNGLLVLPPRDDISSSVKIDLGSMEELGATSADELLQGQVSGVDIIANSGDPGAGSSIVIRGMGSLGNANPLIVVDGIPQDIKKSDDLSWSSADVEDIGALVSIPPSDIQDVQVLKDASATAMWGSQGANGVLLITTKRGIKQKPTFEYTYKIDFTEQPDPIPMLNGDEYVTLQLEELFNVNGIYSTPLELAFEKTYKDYYNYSQNTDWLGAITKQGFDHEHHFGVRGGGDKASYYASVNVLNSDGTTLNTDFSRLTNRINLTYKVSKKIDIDANFVYSKSDRGTNVNPREGIGNVRSMAYIKAPNMSIYEYDQYGNLTGDYFTPISNYQSTNGKQYYNPVALAELGQGNTVENQIESNFSIRYRIGGGFTFRGTVIYQYYNSNELIYVPFNAQGTNWLDIDNNYASQSDLDKTNFQGRAQLFYSKESKAKIKRKPVHSLSAQFTAEAKEVNSSSSSITASQSASIYIQDPAAVAQFRGMRDGFGLSRNLAGRFFASYKFLDKYILTVNGAIEASTKFGADRRWALFPSVSTAWRFGDEEFVQDLTTIIGREARIRFSWGYSGDDGPIGLYDRHATYSSGVNYISNSVVIPKQIQLDNIRWQTKSMYNYGLDLPLFQDRLNIVAEYYNTLTTDLLFDNYKIPTSSGYTQLNSFNGGELQNYGWEFSADGEILRWGPKERNRLRFNFNLSRNTNTLLSYPPNFNNIRNDNLGNGQYPVRVIAGQPIGSFYGLEHLGIYTNNRPLTTPVDAGGNIDYQQLEGMAYAYDANGNMLLDVKGNALPMSYKNRSYIFNGGDPIYNDINHDGTIDILDAVYLGDSNPDIIGGFGANLRLGQWSFSTQFFLRYGFDIVNKTALSTESLNDKNNASKAALYRWRWNGMDEQGMIHRAMLNHPASSLGSDYYVEDGSFLRLNTISIKYELPSELCKKLNIKRSYFSVNARRLLTFTRYSGQNPEVPLGNDYFYFGVDNATTPVSKLVTGTLFVQF